MLHDLACGRGAYGLLITGKPGHPSRIRTANLGAGLRQAGVPAADRNVTSPDPLLEFPGNL